MLNMCMNPKVIGALVVTAGVILVFAPGITAAAIPLLILAACPLSMLLMGGMMAKGSHGEHGAADGTNASATPDAAKEDLSQEVARLRSVVEELRAKDAAGAAHATEPR